MNVVLITMLCCCLPKGAQAPPATLEPPPVAPANTNTAVITPAFFELPMPGATKMMVAGDAAMNGQACVGWASHPHQGWTTKAFLWTPARGMESLGAPTPAESTVAFAVSADGSAIAGYVFKSADAEAFRWTRATGFVRLGILPGSSSSVAYAISADGGTVVGESDLWAFRWTQADGMKRLGLPKHHYSTKAYAVSGDGSVIVGHATQKTEHAFRWTPQTGMRLIGALPHHDTSIALAVSADGRVIVGVSAGGGDGLPFVWTEDEGMQPLGGPRAAPNHFPSAINADGTIVVGEASGPFRWHKDTGFLNIRDFLKESGIDLKGWNLSGAVGVSDDGQWVFGNGTNKGKNKAWLARLPLP